MPWAVSSRPSRGRRAPEQKQRQQVRGAAAPQGPAIGSLESGTPPMTLGETSSALLSVYSNDLIGSEGWSGREGKKIAKKHGLWKKGESSSFFYVLFQWGQTFLFLFWKYQSPPGGLIKAKVKSRSLPTLHQYPFWEFSAGPFSAHTHSSETHTHWTVQPSFGSECQWSRGRGQRCVCVGACLFKIK